MKTITHKTDMTPEFLAECFCELDADEMARFFNHIDAVSSTWGTAGWALQLAYVTGSKNLTLAGRRVMDTIGDHSHAGLPYLEL